MLGRLLIKIHIMDSDLECTTDDSAAYRSVSRVFWSESENRQLIKHIRKLGVIRALVRKRQKNADIFKVVQGKMQKQGSDKTWQQIRSRWKRMKGEYIKEKKLRAARAKETSGSESNDYFFDEMTKVLGKYAESIEFTSLYLGEEEEPLVPLHVSDSGSETGDDGEVQVQVQLIEGDAALEHSVTLDDPTTKEIKIERPSPPSSPFSSNGPNDDTESKEDDPKSQPAKPKKDQPMPSGEVKSFAAEYARKHSMHMREMQDLYMNWYERQIEAQQQWEETFVREQMDLAKNMLESVTSTFLQGMQQILQSVVTSVGQRTFTTLLPNFPRAELNGSAEMPMFFNTDSATNGGFSSETSSTSRKK